MTNQIPERKRFAVLLHEGRHCLEDIRSPRVKVLPADVAATTKHEAMVIPASHAPDLFERLQSLPDEALKRTRTGRSKLVLDASQEGRDHDPTWTAGIHDLLEARGVPLSEVIYVTQNRAFADDYAAYRRERGFGPGMKVVIFDYWLRAVARQHDADGEAEFEARLTAFRARGRRRPWRFLSLNWTLRPTKTLFLLRLIEDGLFERGAISVQPIVRRLWKLERNQLGRPDFHDLNARLAPLLPRLRELSGSVFRTDKADPKLGQVLDDPLPQYGQTWFSVATETEMTDRPLRITEKPLKPLLNFHPLLVFGNPGALRLLRDYGFQTFGGLFDESYDEEPEPRRRFEMVYDEVRRLCAMDQADLDRLERNLEETLIFNAHHALVEMPRRFRRQLDPKLVGELLDA